MLVVLAAGTARADDDYEACRAKRQGIYARARHAVDRQEYERLLRGAPPCERTRDAAIAADIEARPPPREPDPVPDAFRAADALALVVIERDQLDDVDPYATTEREVAEPVVVIDDDEPRVRTPFESARDKPIARTGKPPITAGRAVAETVTGALAGGAGVFIGALVGYGLDCSGGCEGEFGGFGGALAGAYVGGSLGAGLGVYGIGSSDGQTGSFGATIGGAFVGGLAGSLLAALVTKIADGMDYDSPSRKIGDGLAVGVAIAGPLAGAIIGFDLTRRYDAPATVGSVVRLDRGRVAIGIPVIVPSPGGVTLSLASGSF